ncbi:MAG: hypothetical protein U1E37_09420 [Sphingomonadaceae bacterium]
MNRAIAALLLVLPLAACAAGQGEYPSLERRPMERITATYSPVPAPPPAPLPPPPAAVTGRLDGLVAQARGADAKFRDKEGRARTLVSSAAGAKMGTDSWSTATVAVSELEAARGEAMVALTELDLLFNEAVLGGQDASAIGQARDTVIALIGHHDQVLGELRLKLGS